MLKYLAASIIIVVSALLIYFYLLGRASQKQPQMQSSKQQLNVEILQLCPSTPNCVCSEHPQDKPHYISPTDISQYPQIVDLNIIDNLITAAGGSVIDKSQTYLSSVFKSGIFGFVDDVEVRLDHEKREIHFRSASRVGKSDMGVNKKRIEMLKLEFERQLKQ